MFLRTLINWLLLCLNLSRKFLTSLEKVQEGSPQHLDFLSEIQNILQSFSDYLQQSSQSILGLIISIFGGNVSYRYFDNLVLLIRYQERH